MEDKTDNKQNDVIGKVTATYCDANTNDYFNFWTQPDLVLNQFDVIKVKHVQESHTYGIIQKSEHITDSTGPISNYISNDFGNPNTDLKTNIVSMNCVHAKVLWNDMDIYTPLVCNSEVTLASPDEIVKALGFQNIKNKIPCGYLEMYKNTIIDEDDKNIIVPAYLDSHYLIGPEGAHINISGISGLGAKTSYAMFLLKSIYTFYNPKNTKSDNASERGDETPSLDKDDSVAFVVFNVKGKDLLAIDEENEGLNKDENINLNDKDVNTKQIYKDLGLDATPFKKDDVKYYLPFSDTKKDDKSTDKYARSSLNEEDRNDDGSSIKNYAFTYEKDRQNTALLFSSIDDSSCTMDSIFSQIEKGNDVFNGVNSWKELVTKTDKLANESCESKERGGITSSSYKKFFRIINSHIPNNSLFQDPENKNSDSGEEFIRLEDEFKKIENNQIHVIDIAMLSNTEQAFVFLHVLKTLFKKQENKTTDKDNKEQKNSPSKIVVFIDELNKYASKDMDQGGPIMREILDVAERGRSLGLSLFSAEQFRSAINSRITGNCASHAYGRSNSPEIKTPDYGSMPNSYKSMLCRLQPGEYIVDHPVWPSPLRIKFPKPFYKQFKN